jgi:hypothetical protein
MFQEGVCLANLLAIGEPRGAGAGEGAASLVGVFSLEGTCLAICEDRWPRPLLGGRRPRSDFDSQLTIVDGRGNLEVAKRKGELWAKCAVSTVRGLQTGKCGWDSPMAAIVREVFQNERVRKTRCDVDRRGSNMAW